MEAWIVIGLIITATALCLLYSLADNVRVESQIHDTKIKARNLRDAYAAQLAELQAKQAMEAQISIVGQGAVTRPLPAPSAAPPAAQAA